MLNFIVIAAGIALIVMWFMGGTTAPTVYPVPLPKLEAAPKPIENKKPRWHKYDVLLELQDCLLHSGNDEKTVKEICERIAPLLLGCDDEK